MKRSTWITLGVFGLLLGVWLLQSRPQPASAPTPLSISGYLGNLSAEDARAAAQQHPAPYTRIVLKRSSGADGLEVIELTRDATTTAAPTPGGPPPEAKWHAKRTLAGKTTACRALGFRATAMAEQLQRSIRATYAVRLDGKNAEEYGLDAAHVLDVELSGEGVATVQLRVGLLQKAEHDGDATTWLADPARPEIAHQIVGRDLRSAFDFTWNDLRDRQLLALDVAGVTRLELRRPGSTPAKVVVTRAAAGSVWQIAEPAGVRAGDIDDWLNGIAHLSAAEFVADGDPARNASGLDNPDAAILTIDNGQGQTTLIIGNVDESRPNKEVWLRVQGRDEAYRVAAHQRDQVLLSLDQLRDRRVLAGKTADTIQAIAITGPTGPFGARRTADGWRATGGEPADSAKIAAFVAGLNGVKVDFLAAVPASAALDHPEWTLNWTFADGNSQVRLSKEEAGSVYGQLRTSASPPQFFKLASWAARPLQKQPADFHSMPAAKGDPADQMPPPVPLVP